MRLRILMLICSWLFVHFSTSFFRDYTVYKLIIFYILILTRKKNLSFIYSMFYLMIKKPLLQLCYRTKETLATMANILRFAPLDNNQMGK